MKKTNTTKQRYPGLNPDQQGLLQTIARHMAALKGAGKIRTNNLTAELGELYAKSAYKLKEFPVNTPGVDLQSKDENTLYQVKTRRLFRDPHRKSKQTGLVPGLEKEGYDVAIIVVIGAEYELLTLFAVSRTKIDALIKQKQHLKNIRFHVRELWKHRDDSVLNTIGQFDPEIMKKR